MLSFRLRFVVELVQAVGILFCLLSFGRHRCEQYRGYPNTWLCWLSDPLRLSLVTTPLFRLLIDLRFIVMNLSFAHCYETTWNLATLLRWRLIVNKHGIHLVNSSLELHWSFKIERNDKCKMDMIFTISCTSIGLPVIHFYSWDCCNRVSIVLFKLIIGLNDLVFAKNNTE